MLELRTFAIHELMVFVHRYDIRRLIITDNLEKLARIVLRYSSSSLRCDLRRMLSS
jgi:hypothetical protein